MLALGKMPGCALVVVAGLGITVALDIPLDAVQGDIGSIVHGK